MRRSLYFLLLLVFAHSGRASAQSIPNGLWQSKEEGFVVRIEACGPGFCGFAAGLPAGHEKDKDKDPKKACGKQTWHNFQWNQKDARWDGSVNPPDMDKSIKAFVKSDNRTFLTLTAKVMFLTKTMNFKPFTGTVNDACEIKP